MKYKITFKNQLKVLDLLIVTIALIFLFALYQVNQNNFDDNLLNGLIVFTLFNLLPVIYLHIEYYFFNKGSTIEINSYEKTLNYKDKIGLIETYVFKDINKIVLYMPPHFHSSRMFVRIPFDNYHYAKIYTKSGKEIIITCLLAPKVMDLVRSIKGVPVEKKKRIFASILLG